MADLEQQIIEAQKNPLYHTVYDITKNVDNIEDARTAIKQFGIDNNLDASQLSEFFDKHEFAFFSNGNKVPNLNSYSDVQFGVQSKVQNNTNKKTSYQSKNTGGRKQRRQDKQNRNNDYKIEEFNNIHADNTRKANEKMYGEMFDQIEATDKNQARARVFKEAAAKGNEQIAANNVIDSIFPLIEDASDLETAQSKIAEWAKKSGLDKENRMEMRSFLHDNWEDISKKQKANLTALIPVPITLLLKIFLRLDSPNSSIPSWALFSTTSLAIKLAFCFLDISSQLSCKKLRISILLSLSNLRKIFNKRVIGTGINAVMAYSDYKEARNEGKGVIGSTVKAGTLFAAGEILGGAMIPVMLAKSAPQLAVSTIEGAQRMTRQMNSVQRIQTFGDAEFMDTKQLATMRQAGMELAKMSQYNLQQSMMGNEAQYMHRI